MLNFFQHPSSGRGEGCGMDLKQVQGDGFFLIPSRRKKPHDPHQQRRSAA
jgi:hypothetical protein